MPTYIALLRGINVGGNHVVKMADLVALHEALGFTRVRAYIQSGNVVFSGDDGDAEALQGCIEERFEERFGFRSEVYVRSVDAMRRIIARDPFHGRPGRDPRWVVVTFLPAGTDAAAWADVIASYPGPEEVVLIGDELHMYYPNGVGASKLPTTALGRKLKTVGTARNWNTVLKLYELMQP